MAIRKLAATLSPSEIAQLRRAVGADSTFTAAKRLGLSPHTLDRGLAGLGLRQGTQCQLRLALKLVAAQQEPRP